MKIEREQRREIVVRKLQTLQDMLVGMVERGHQINRECRRYWQGAFESVLDLGHSLGCLEPSEDGSWRAAFGGTLAMLTDTEAMRRARARHQESEVKTESKMETAMCEAVQLFEHTKGRKPTEDEVARMRRNIESMVRNGS